MLDRATHADFIQYMWNGLKWMVDHGIGNRTATIDTTGNEGHHVDLESMGPKSFLSATIAGRHGNQILGNPENIATC